MARPRVISAARQRYEMVPVLDENGNQKTVRTAKKDRRGNPVMRKLTVADHTKPLPPRKCEKCGSELEIGKPFRVVSVKTQRGGYDRFRCMNCPVWQPWELSNSLSARCQQIQSERIDRLRAGLPVGGMT